VVKAYAERSGITVANAIQELTNTALSGTYRDGWQDGYAAATTSNNWSGPRCSSQ
jgi:hypothetical protein